MAHKSDVDTEGYKAKFYNLKTKFTELSENEIRSFVNEQDSQIKIQKANELLAKILKIFLVDVGLRLTQLNKDFEKSNQQTQINSNNNRSYVDNYRPENVPSSQKSCTKMVCEEMYGPVRQSNSKLNWKAKELDLKDVKSDKDISDFLKKVKVKSLNPYIVNSRRIDLKSLELFEGRFLGEIVFDNDPERPHQAELLLYDLVEGSEKKSNGNFEFIIKKNNKKYSHQTGNGEINKIRTFAKGSLGFLLNVSLSSQIQVYTNSDNSILFGNFYRSKNTNYTPVGKMLLYRQ